MANAQLAFARYINRTTCLVCNLQDSERRIGFACKRHFTWPRLDEPLNPVAQVGFIDDVEWCSELIHQISHLLQAQNKSVI